MKRRDYILLTIITCLVLLSLLFTIRTNKENRAYIYYHNELVMVVDLGVDKEYKIDDHITLDVKEGKIAVIENDCVNKTCIKQGYSNNLPIICAYNNLIIAFSPIDYDMVV